jgi:hypothetical protein
MRLPDPERSRVVLIGTTAYSDAELNDLPMVERSVLDLAAVLTDPLTGIVPRDRCTVMIDEGDLRELGRRLRRAASEAEDLLLVLYAGHGLVGRKRHDLYLALPDSEWGAPEFNSLEYEKLRGAVLDSPASSKVVILDCCFSGRALDGLMADPGTAVLGQLDVEGTYVLTSAQRDKVALALPGEEHTAFSGRLLRLLREGDPGGPEFLGIEALYQGLRSIMRANSLPLPEKRATRSAELIAIGRNRAFRPPPPPAADEGPGAPTGRPRPRPQPRWETLQFGRDEEDGPTADHTRQVTGPAEHGWGDVMEVARQVERDGRQRPVDRRFETRQEAAAAKEVLFGLLRGDAGSESKTAHVRPWIWTPASGGSPLTEYGRQTGVELRLSYYRKPYGGQGAFSSPWPPALAVQRRRWRFGLFAWRMTLAMGLTFSGILSFGAVGATVTGDYPDVGSAVAGNVIFETMLATFATLLAREARRAKRRSAKLFGGSSPTSWRGPAPEVLPPRSGFRQGPNPS